jgi:hypothetical protein
MYLNESQSHDLKRTVEIVYYMELPAVASANEDPDPS